MGRHAKQRNSRRYLLTVVGVAALAVSAFVVSLAMRPTGTEPAGQQTANTPSSAPTTPPPSGPTTASLAPPPAPAVTLALAGDVHFTGRTEPLLDDPSTAFGSISQTLSEADIAMVNLETAITERGVEAPKEYHFRAPSDALDALAAAGIDVATLANNHSVDYGPIGLQDTLAAIEAGPIAIVGIGEDAAAAYAPYRAEIRGVGISIFGASQIPDWTYRQWTATETSAGIASTAERSRLLDGVSLATAAGDVVIVYLHWGIENDACPTPAMVDLANDLADAGADAIVGSHSHLLLGAGYLDRAGGPAYVAYGLGNFLWWRPQAASDETGVLTLTVQGGSVTGSVFTPALLDEAGRPQPLLGPEVPERVDAFHDLRGCAGLLATPAG